MTLVEIGPLLRRSLHIYRTLKEKGRDKPTFLQNDMCDISDIPQVTMPKLECAMDVKVSGTNGVGDGSKQNPDIEAKDAIVEKDNKSEDLAKDEARPVISLDVNRYGDTCSISAVDARRHLLPCH